MQLLPKKVLEEFLEGNRRFVSGETQSPRSELSYALELKDQQNPRAVILACSDSRYPLAKIFDQGIGDIFEVRVAGNVLNNDVIASIQYVVSVVKTQLVIVLGHSNCGACIAALSQDMYTNEINTLLRPLKRQINYRIRSSKDPALALAESNVRDGVAKLPLLLEKGVLVVGGIYHLDTGVVEIL